MKTKIFTDEEAKARHLACSKRYQKRMVKERRVEHLRVLVEDVFKLEMKGLTASEIAVELEKKGYMGTKKERKENI